MIGGKRDAVLDLLTNKTSPNGGVDVTDDLKYTSMYPASLTCTIVIAYARLICAFSQVQQAEQYPRLADRPLRRSHRQRNLELLGREGVEGVLAEEGRVKRTYKIKLYYSSPEQVRPHQGLEFITLSITTFNRHL